MVFTSFTILLSVSGTIVSLVAYYALGYSSEVYTNFGQQKVSIKRLHGKIAAQALIAGSVWNNLGLTNKTKPGFDVLKELFMKQGYNEEDGSYLAKALLSTSHKDVDQGVKMLNSMSSSVTQSSLTFLTSASTKESVDDPESVKELNKEEDPFADVRTETMDMAEFCDLVSEEETSLSAAMGALGGGELELIEESVKEGIVLIDSNQV